MGYITISTNVRRYENTSQMTTDSAQMRCACSTFQLSEKKRFSCFPVLPGSAEAQDLRWHSKASFDCLLYR